MDLIPVGIVKSPRSEATDEGWRSVVSEIHLQPGLGSGLQGLDQFSHAIIVFHMHEARFDWKHDVLCHPDGHEDLPEVGIFAQRARTRPNSIGITAVEIVGVDGDVLRVKGLDAINGTPVLDIKPYFPAYDYIESARVPEWVDRLMKRYS